MMDTKKDEQEPEPVPVLGSWRRIYWFVALFFVAEVVAFYLFTRHYS